LQDIHFDPTEGRDDKFAHTQTYAALQYRIPKQKLFVKVVGAYALGQFAPNFMGPVFENKMFSGRLRLEYLF
jgi:hypothetical protein